MKKTLFFLWISCSSIAQIADSTSLVFEHTDRTFNQKSILSLEENGLLYIELKSDLFYTKNTVNIVKYDTAFQQNWAVSFQPNFRYNYIGRHQTDDYYYELYQEPESSKMGIFWVSIKEGNWDFVEGNLLTSKNITHFKVIGNKALIGGEYNDKPVVVMFNLADKSTRVLSNIHLENLALMTLEVNEKNDEFWVILSNRRDCSTITRSFASDGKPKGSFTSGGKNMHLLSANVLNTQAGQKILVGNYATDCSDYARGIFVLPITNSETHDIITHPFYKLSHFYDYLPEKKQVKMKEKLTKKEERGLPNFQKFKMTLHDLYHVDGQNILIGEFYYPETKYTTINNTNVLPRSSRIGANTFTSYVLRYTHFVILKITETGQIIWDHSVPFEKQEVMMPQKNLQVNFANDYIFTGYPYEGTVLLSAFQNDILKSKNEKINVFDKGKLSYFYNRSANISAWYKNNFLVWGEKEAKNGENVFFVSKLKYGLQ